MKKLLSIVLCIIFLTGCQNTTTSSQSNTSVSSNHINTNTISAEKDIFDSTGKVIKYSNIRKLSWKKDSMYKSSEILNENEYVKDDISTYTFNESLSFEGCEDYKKQVMEAGKDPGLGVRSLHEQGITGKGVNVAIIDQHLLLNHPEIKGKIIKYYDSGCNMPKHQGSMHAPAVTSLLVGNSIGVAPGAKLYFAAAPGCQKDSKYFAECLDWIIEENKKLPKSEKIRAVSVSAAPSGKGSPCEKNNDMWDKTVKTAEKQNILVIDCTSEKRFVYPGFFKDVTKRETPDLLSYGYNPEYHTKLMKNKSDIDWNENLIVPVSTRTVAEQYYESEYGYTYCGVGGLSWGIPYATGVMALGWQVNPELDAQEMKDLLLKSAYVDENKLRYIDPVSFIEEVENTLK